MAADYDETALLRLAKRYGNKQRSYLLVNPLQAKHIPVSPRRALQMMFRLGQIVSAQGSGGKLVIGFAETATAIGAVVAQSLGEDSLYITTTRENIIDGEWLSFAEEHSHAVTQRLDVSKLAALSNDASPLVFVDDEISTGHTLLNATKKLKLLCSQLSARHVLAASVINRQNEEQARTFEKSGVDMCCLLRLPQNDYATIVENFTVDAPIVIDEHNDSAVAQSFVAPKNGVAEVAFLSDDNLNYADPRRGVIIGKYFSVCRKNALRLVDGLAAFGLKKWRRLLILGTEECMLPALILGEEIEREYPSLDVFCHATTRSPIGVCRAADYPITNGYVIPSFYDKNRVTYIYNLASYDAAVVLTDSLNVPDIAVEGLAKVLGLYGVERLFIAKMAGEVYV